MTTTEFKDRVLCFGGKLYVIAYSILQNRENAEDAVQEVYARLWRMRDKLNELKSIEAFAVTVTKNFCIDMIRAERIKVDYPHLKSDDPPPENVMDARSKLGMITQILDTLPQKQRQVFNLRHFSDCSIEEISKMTELSEQNVRTILSRVRTLIKTKIENHE